MNLIRSTFVHPGPAALTAHALFIAALSALLAAPAPVAAENGEDTGAEAALTFIDAQEPPVFADGHTLPPLGHWRSMPAEVQRELATHWGYALYTGRLNANLIEQMRDPDSDVGRMLEWANAYPERYPLQVLVHPAASSRGYLDELPRESFLLDADGDYVLGERTRLLSPEAPDETFEFVGRFEAELVREVRELIGDARGDASIDLITHGAEFGFNAAGHNQENYEQDPRVSEAIVEYQATHDENVAWMQYLSDQRGRMERIVREAVKAEAPESLYILYKETAGGNTHRKRWSGWWRWGFLYRPGTSDLASPSLYWSEDSFTFDERRGDLVTHLLNARAQEIDAGAEHAYYWHSGGWPGRGYADAERYTGWLKVGYVAGGLGAVAGFFSANPHEVPAEKSMPQFLALGHVHAMFSHLEDFLRNSDLLPGPNPHVFSDDLPAYELPTAYDDHRVLARRHRERDQWLAVAWAGDGEVGDATVTIPDLGEVTLTAHPAGHVYRLEPGNDGDVTIEMLDPEPMDPTARWR